MQLTNTIRIFFRNSVISIPIINFIIACVLLDKFLIALTIGLLLSGLLNYIIKYTIYISTNSQNRIFFLRPKNAKGCDACCDDLPAHDKIGLPSGHSQLIWFFSIYLFLYSYHKYIEKSFIILPILILLAVSISLSRLGWFGNECHTPFQVIIGALIGSITAYYYFNVFFKFFGI
jgi:membrane-associated phospholipid phosphatase